MATSAKCPHFLKCPFFNNRMAAMPTVVEQLQRRYCNDDYRQCARYLVNQKFIQGYSPRDEKEASSLERDFDILFPNNIEKAEEIIHRLVK